MSFITQTTAGVTIDFGDGNSITLIGIASLNDADFVFASS
jgi:hypothetical protein